MDICHLNNAELESKHQKYRGRAALFGDSVKDGFRIIRIIHWTRIVGLAQTSGLCRTMRRRSICLHPSQKWRTRQGCLKNPKSECPHVFQWILLPRHKCPKSWSNIENTVVLLERNLYGHPLAGLLRRRLSQEVLWRVGWEKVTIWKCLFVCSSETRIVLVGKRGWHLKMAGSNHNLSLMWKRLMKLVDLGEPTSLLDHVDLGCNQRECKANDRKFSQISRTVRITNFCNSNLLLGWSQLQGKVGTVGELSQVCSQIVLKCLYLARIGGLETFFGWYTNLLEQSQNGLELVANSWLVWFLILITQMTTDIVMWETRVSIVDWVYFRTQILLATLRTRNQLREESYVSSDAERLSPSVGCAISKLLSRTVYRVWNYFTGCWIMYGWALCSWFMGCVDRSATFVEQQIITNQGNVWKRKRAQGSSEKLLAHDDNLEKR